MKETAKTNDAALDLLAPGPGEDILEIGFGPGRTLGLLGERGARVTGVDVSEEMVRAGSPGGQVGASLQSSAADLIPMASTSEQSLPGLDHDPTPVLTVVS